MTYCVGIALREGLIMISDTRTNAGIDNISIYRKMHILADTDDRLILCMSAGNLSVTQHVLGQLDEGLPPLGIDEHPRKLLHVPTMFRAAQLIGEIDEIQVKISPLLLGAGVPLFGGLPQPVALEAVDLRALPGGVALATYRRRDSGQL